jgi:hypothetical protein
MTSSLAFTAPCCPPTVSGPCPGAIVRRGDRARRGIDRFPRSGADAPGLHPRLRPAAAIAAPRGAGGLGRALIIRWRWRTSALAYTADSSRTWRKIRTVRPSPGHSQQLSGGTGQRFPHKYCRAARYHCLSSIFLVSTLRVERQIRCECSVGVKLSFGNLHR